jgi:peptidoglycan hydrolase-like protein with peptidoglycan-binding domain
MENKLNEELLRQLLLMNFDRGKTLSEQKVIPSDRLGAQGNFQPNIKPQTPAFLKTEKENYNDDKQVAISAYNKIVYEIDGGWAPWKWGTDEQGMSDAILSIKNLQQYQILRELLGKKYDKSKYPNTLLGFIQEQEFSTGENDFISDLYRNQSFNNATIGQEYQYRTNDKFLRQMETHLQKFNPDEKFARTGLMNRTATSFVLPPAASQAIHIALPVLSLVTSFFPPASIMFELIDAGIYYAEGDKYSAGLGFLFAFIPAGQFAMLSKNLTKAEKQVLMKKVQKDAAGEAFESYTEKELKIMKSLGEEGTQRMIRKELSKRAIIETIDEMTSINVMYKSIWWMVKKGYLPARFLTQMGITVGGTFYTWDYIASVLKICNPMGLKGLTKAEEGYLQMIGGAAKFLQQFSTSCEKERALRDFADRLSLLEKNIKDLVLKRLQNIVDANLNFTKDRFGTTYSLEAISIQLSLRNLGFTKFTEIKKSYMDVKIYEPVKDELPGLSDYEIRKQQNYDPSGGIGQARLSSGLPATGNWKTDQDEYVKMMKLPKEERKVVDVTFKWGYYDYNTKMVVEEFQKKNNLTVDGEVGPNTAKKLIEKVNGLQSINPFDSKIEKLTKEEVLKVEQDVVKKIQSENKNPLTEEDLNKKPDFSQTKEVKEDLKNNTSNSIENMDPNSWNLNIIVDEYDSAHPPQNNFE